uniref:Cap-specific mRNA (nucleoside-2'-O-)-methyltransferase 1 n=1 Tax=Anopheles coluzzii TaxID=1518534 RepID=A0A8W7PQV8_ANOCL
MASSANLSADSSAEEQETLSDDSHKNGKRKHTSDSDSDQPQKRSGMSMAPAAMDGSQGAAATTAAGGGAAPFSQFSEKSFRMMKQMGYKAGTGLGKTGQGRVDLIETSSQKGRSGLGMKLNELNTAAEQWDGAEERLQIPEVCSWLVNVHAEAGSPGITREQLDAWIRVGPRKLLIDDEHRYCEPDVLAQILASKSVFNNLGADDMRKARSKSNPFELIKSNIFINRAAVKMANMDSMFGFMLTSPVDRHGQPLVFDLFTPFSVGLVYLAYRCFREISICKPNSSRPANSERYLVCKWKLPQTDLIQRHLEDVNRQMYDNRNANIDTLELVSEEVLRADATFHRYVCDSNNAIGRNQIAALLKIAAFCRNRDLAEPRQMEVKQKCLALWKLPDGIRKFANKGDPDQYVAKLYKEWNSLTKEVCQVEKRVQNPELRQTFPSVYDWCFVPIGTVENAGKNLRTILLGKGGKEVYRFEPKQCSWIPVTEVSIELPPGTIIYAEIVRELQGQGKSQIVIHTLHIIDGLLLGGENIRRLPLRQRLARCQQFAKALNKPLKGTVADSTNGTAVTVQIRAKRLYGLHEIEHFFGSLETYSLKTGPPRLGYRVRNLIDPDRFYVPYGLLFLKETKPDYMKSLSKTRRMFYYYHVKTKSSRYPEQFEQANHEPETMALFEETYHSRLLWRWETVHQVDPEYGADRSADSVYRVDFRKYVRENYEPGVN